MQNQPVHKPHFGNHAFNLFIGVVGMLISSYGNLIHQLHTQKWCYFFGASLLLVSSLLERHKFFIALQIIIVAGTITAFTPFSFLLKAAIPIILSAITIIYFAITKQLEDKLTLLGSLGIAFLAAGYAVSRPIVFFFGAVVLMIYSFISYRRGAAIALIWALLNVIFAATATVAIYHAL
jgi:hypothetical protein